MHAQNGLRQGSILVKICGVHTERTVPKNGVPYKKELHLTKI